MFGPTPAWGLWCRHVRGLTVEGLNLTTRGDGRAAIRLDNVAGAKVTKVTRSD